MSVGRKAPFHFLVRFDCAAFGGKKKKRIVIVVVVLWSIANESFRAPPIPTTREKKLAAVARISI